MPFYTYICEDCDSEFEIFASIQKKGTGWKPACPQCDSAKTRQTFAAVTVNTSMRHSSSRSGCCESRKGAGR